MSLSPAPPLPLVAVIGSGTADTDLYEHARAVGATIARVGAGIVCGGLGGVMEAACRGAHEVVGRRAGRTVGILPGSDPTEANPWIDLPIATGAGTARNLTVVLSARAVIAVGGESGTLSEIAHAWQLGKPVAGYVPAGGWGGRLAGERIDERRDDEVVALADLERLELWLRDVLPGIALRRP